MHLHIGAPILLSLSARLFVFYASFEQFLKPFVSWDRF